MKKITSILVALLCLSSTPVLAKILYCVGDEAVGFEPANNYSFSRFYPKRFQVDVDFERMTMKSDTLLISPDKMYCWTSTYDLRCRSRHGSKVLAIDSVTLKFHLSSTFFTPPGLSDPDSIYLEHGSCEAF